MMDVSIYKIDEKLGFIWISNEDGDDVDPTPVPTEWKICDTCRGNGKHSLAVDGHGITQEERDRDWDDESWQNYLDGAYDKTCGDCNGAGKVKVVCFDQLPEHLQKAVQEYYDGEAEYRAECEAERRFGC
jgi:hypothetical protein